MGSHQHQPTKSPVADAERPAATHRRRLMGWIALVAYSAFLVSRALLRHRADEAGYVPLWELYDWQRLVGWIGALVFAGFCKFAAYLPVGFFSALAVVRRPHRLPFHLGALTLAGGVAILAWAVGDRAGWRLGAAAGLVLGLLGCLFGAWMGTTWLRGRRARAWLPAKIALLLLSAVAGVGVFLWLSVEDKPLPFESVEVTSAGKRQVVHLIRSKSPRSLEEGQTHTLRLAEEDVNLLLAWGLSLGPVDRKAQVRFAPDAVSLEVSVGIARTRRYLNLQLAGDVGISNGDLNLRVDRFRLGRLEVPMWLVNPLCPVVASLLSHDRRARPFLDAIEAVAIGPDWIEATYGRIDLPPGFREDLFGPGGVGEEVLASTRVQVDHLLAVVGVLPRSEPPTFALCFETAFTLARDRSVTRDPVAENRAAIFALGMLLGHHRVEEFLAPGLLPQDSRPARQALQRVRIRNRSDWTKHFCVSAALTLLSDAIISDAAGLLKEELDADIGGSGFSFGDLLADRAGTTFAIHATRDEASARRIQERIARGFDVDDFFPPAADLPEGIPDAELQSDYGGVGGRRYRRLIEEIERRIAACAAYR